MGKDIPKYQRLKEILLRQIKTGVLKPGEPVPSERALAIKYGYSRMTIRQAVTELVKTGVLYREQGRGTFVAKRIFMQRNIMSFTNAVRQRGLVPTTKVLAFFETLPPDDVAAALSVPENRPVYYAKRLRMAGDVPVAVETVYIPKKTCPVLQRDDLFTSLHEMMRDRYGHRLHAADLNVTAALPSPDEQKLLSIRKTDPVLFIDSLYFSPEGVRLYFEKGCYKGDMYRYNIRIFT